MNPGDMIVPTVLFWVLAMLAISLAPRYGIIAYILLVQFDLTAMAFYADSSFGWQNAIKTVVIPTILLIRIRPFELLPAAFGSTRNFWIALVGYACIAIAWSPYRLSAVKMMGYFYSYSVVFIVFTHAWRRRWFTRESFITIATLSLLFGAIQTYLLGNPYGNVDKEGRFTSFSDAQSFAPFLLCLVILLMLCAKRTFASWLVAAATIIAFVLTGSRSYFVGFAWVALIVGLAMGKRFRQKLSLGLIVKSVLIGSAVIALLTVFILRSLPQSRLNELLEVATIHNDSVEDVQTFAWRLTIWGKTVQEIAGRSVPGLLIGSGTSSGAVVAMETGYFQEANVDPNRCIHDEFLRSLYEWGAIGLLVFVCFLFALFRLSLRLARLTKSSQAWACLAVSGPLLIGLLIENILADGASPGGIGYCLIFAAMVAQLRPAIVKAKVKVPAEIVIRPAGAMS
jgi:O-antigen ligase